MLGLLGCSDNEQSKLVAHMLAMHQAAEAQLGAAPRHFLSCAELYSTTVVSKRERLLQQQKFLKVGVRGQDCLGLGALRTAIVPLVTGKACSPCCAALNTQLYACWTFCWLAACFNGCLQSGLGRLAEAASTIDELSQQAQVQRSLLARKQEEADQAMADIQVSGPQAVALIPLCNSSGPLLLT